MGKEGFKKLALINLERAEYLKSKLASIPGFEIPNGATFNEFPVKLKKDAKVFVSEMASEGFIAGLPASCFYPQDKNTVIMNATENTAVSEIDLFVKAASKRA